jgi:16S rRNA (adenine1518-N6/adenine1519-N6)-dimethyltransferase
MSERAGLAPSDIVLEIGPGKGILTKELLKSPCARLDALELDTKLKDELEPIARNDGRLKLYWTDALRFDYSKLSPPPTHVIANLPYHITTPVIWALLENFAALGLRYMLLMVQKEAAQRLVSGAASRASCPLGITLSAMGDIAALRQVPRSAFSPVPRVDSAIVEARLYGGENGRRALPRDKIWRRLLSGSFAQRRKTLVNNWAGSFGMSKEHAAEALASCSLPPRSRPEELTLEAWLALFSDEKFRGHLIYSKGVKGNAD